MLHYLPGCDVQKNHKEAIAKIVKYMKERGAIIDKCCRVKEKLLNDEDVMVNNCTLCELVLKETHPNNKVMSLYEYVLKDESFKWPDHQGEKITIQDCWRTRDNYCLQQSIRECLKRMNFEIIELKDNFDKTTFDGVWLYNNPAKDCLEVAPHTFNHIIDNYTHLLDEEMQIKKMKEWCAQYQTDKILVYCNGCERGIRLGGCHPIHIVELIAEFI